MTGLLQRLAGLQGHEDLPVILSAVIHGRENLPVELFSLTAMLLLDAGIQSPMVVLLLMQLEPALCGFAEDPARQQEPLLLGVHGDRWISWTGCEGPYDMQRLQPLPGEEIPPHLDSHVYDIAAIVRQGSQSRS